MKAAILATIVLAFSVSQASAVSLAVKLACADDYFAHCSMHAVGSPGVRTCMRAVGRNLAPKCISALAAAGEIKQTKMASAKKTTVAQRPVKKQYADKSSGRKTYANKVDARRRYARNTDAPKQYARKQGQHIKLARN